MKIYLILGDCLEKLKELPENSVDSIVTDPPYELGFMGKSWDNTGIANDKNMWAECLRVLKPGGHLLAFSGTRTYHRMAVAIEDAGFEVRDMIEWVYGSGFPKSLNIGKAVDKLQGNEREYISTTVRTTHKEGTSYEWAGGNDTGICDYTKGNSEYEGWGTALKPAHEPICMARKPLAEKTVAENCLKWGTGGINVDESRVSGEYKWRASDSKEKGDIFKEGSFGEQSPLGRFPANLIHDNSEEVRECFPESKSAGKYKEDKLNTFKPDKAMFALGYQTNAYAGDSGNASRFFKSIIYQAKASKSNRGEGNNHPTVKPIALMEYLIKMVTPKGGIVLDPFMGSGSTGVACMQNSYQFIGIELELEYMKIAEQRLKVKEILSNPEKFIPVERKYSKCPIDPNCEIEETMKYVRHKIPHERLPEASKTKDRALQEDWEKRYADMLKEFKRQTKIDMVADVLVMKSFISKEISYANQDGFDEGYGKGGMEGLKEGRADARKEVERKVKELSRYTDGVIAIKVVDGKTWIDKDKNQLVRLYDVLATLREEEKHG